MTEKRALVDDVRKWIGSYLYLEDPTAALMLAIWSIGTWTYDRFFSFPYLTVNGTGPNCGKSRVLELLKALSRAPMFGVNPSAAGILRWIDALDGKGTLLWDEAESTDKAGDFMGQLANSGYRRGQTILRAQGEGYRTWKSYCPKAFGLIGSPNPALASRSLILTMERGKSAATYNPETAEYEGAMLADRISRMSRDSHALATEDCEFLPVGRDREIWGSIFGLATWLDVAPADVAALRAYAVAMTERRAMPVKAAIDHLAMKQRDAADYMDRLIADLPRTIRPDDRKDAKRGTFILSSELVERLVSLPDAPWSAFQGRGLDQRSLYALMLSKGVRTFDKRIGGKTGVVLRAYAVSDFPQAEAKQG